MTIAAPTRGWANAVAYANSYKTVHPSVQSTALRTQELRYRTLSHTADARIAETFLVNTRLRRGDWESESSIASYFSDLAIRMLAMRSEEGCPYLGEVILPRATDLPMRLDETLGRRRSSRHFTGDSMPLDYLAGILRAGAGLTGEGEATLASGEQARLSFRTAPSAGGLYPIDIHVVALRVDGLRRGLYKYDPFAVRLLKIGTEDDVDSVVKGFAMTEDMISIGLANVVLLLVARPWRSMRKYGPRGMRFVFMEAGSIAQNVNLATTALGFGSVECASTYDDEINEALRIDGTFETLVHSIIIGYAG